jgi:probable selenium-dependent hydroxylase accessory protein YqeC
MSLAQAFNLQPGDVISLVGGGGKSTLMLALAAELACGGASLVTTTTTHILESQAEDVPLILDTDEDRMAALLLEQLKGHRQVALAAERRSDRGKLKGVSPELVDRIAALEQVDYVVIEADGAARKPLKAPNATEPVIPLSTSLVIALVGFDALGARLNNDEVFRPEIISRLTGLAPGDTITKDAIATLITHPEGIIKGSPSSARVIPFINKVDQAQDTAQAEALARIILDKQHPQIERVILGQARHTKPIVSIIKRGQRR